ncbi:HEAT repeat domain-containing protein [Myxococcota bacterium]|nr:HEAT repeat domain-containing protein [Myxococcota bacterium]
MKRILWVLILSTSCATTAGCGKKKTTGESGEPPAQAAGNLKYDLNGSVDQRRKALDSLREASGSGALEQLQKAAQSEPEDDLRESAVVALGAMGDAGAIQVLGRAAREDLNAHIRRRAAEALGRIRDARSADALAQLWLDPKDDPEAAIFNLEVQSAFVSLGTIALPALRRGLKHESYQVRWKVISALEKIGDASVIIDLQPLLDDPNPTVQDAAAAAIQALKAAP